jgi:glycosyltransferase involved in cell wall biosynthesis
MNTPLISIISPTYNHEKYIEECIESVLAQTYQNWEMYIMDDGSSDKTGEISKIYVTKDPRIKYHFQNHIGVHRLHETYNKALSLCNGKYIAILECDDVWYPNKLQRQVEALESNSECVLAWASVYNSREKINDILKFQPDEEQLRQKLYFENKPIGIINRAIYFGNFIPALTLIIRKDVLNSIGGFKYLENLPLIDQPTLYHLANKGPFFYDEQPLGVYRRYSTQTTKKLTLDIVKGNKIYISEHYNSLTAKQKEIIGLSHRQLANKLATMEMTSRASYARACLIRKEFSIARKEYLNVAFFPSTFNLLWRIRGLIGFCFGVANMNVESVAKKLGKRYYK